jgi:hypothetical protein
MKPRFKDAIQQQVYDAYLGISPEGIYIILRRQGTSTDVAFARGFDGEPLIGVHDYNNTSAAYAAYAAGKEIKKRGIQ